MTLAEQHANSMIESIRARIDSGAPFGHINDVEEWHDIDECEADCDKNEAGAWDYLNDALDIQYLVNADRSYRHARILVSFGGPNVWIDTRTRELEVHWGGDRVARNLPSSFVVALDDALEDMWSAY